MTPSRWNRLQHLFYAAVDEAQLLPGESHRDLLPFNNDRSLQPELRRLAQLYAVR